MAGKRQEISNDLIENLNSFWTCTILVVFISCVGILKYVFPTSAITCWTPNHFQTSHTAYTHGICGNIENLEVLNTTQMSVTGISNIVNVPIFSILVFMIIGFKIPQMFKIIAGVSNCWIQPARDTNRQELDQLIQVVEESIVQRSNYRFITLLIFKALIVLNLFVQFVFVTTYFHETTITETITTTNASGFNETVTIEKTPYVIFPKTVHCGFSIRSISNLHMYFIQCDVPIHYLYENFFYLYWFWIIALGVLTLIAEIVRIASLLVMPLKKIMYGAYMTHNMQQASPDTLLILTDIEVQYGSVIALRITSQLKPSVSNTTALQSARDEIPLMTIRQ